MKDKTAVIVTKPGKTLTKEVVETAVKNSKDGLSVTSFEQVKEEAKKEPTKEKPEAAQPPPKG
ncbi:MAG: hypothetical protein IT462_13380 [Planctomycetes bacterium]|nr:hypothetical protein [Planctomycetota bacterium]